MSVDQKQPKGYRKAWNGEFKPASQRSGTCEHCGALLSSVTRTCVMGRFCPGVKNARPDPSPGSRAYKASADQP